MVLRPHNEDGWQDDIDYLELLEIVDGEEKYRNHKLPYGLPEDERQERPILRMSQAINRDTMQRHLSRAV